MTYTTHHRFRKLSMSGEKLNLPYGTELKEENNIIYTLSGKPICFATSQNAKQHFSRNDDGQGLMRGAITYAIAFAARKNKDEGFRFTQEERNLLCEKYNRFLRNDTDYLLFNDDFFTAEISDLQAVAADLKIKIKV